MEKKLVLKKNPKLSEFEKKLILSHCSGVYSIQEEKTVSIAKVLNKKFSF